MIADKESVVGRDSGAKVLDRRLVVRRSVAQLDQRLLAGKRIESGIRTHAFRQRGWQVDHGRQRRSRSKAAERHAGAGRPNEVATCQHGRSPENGWWSFFLPRANLAEYSYH